MGDLQRDFSLHEFACPCGCKTNNMCLETVRRWQVVRDWAVRLFIRDLKVSEKKAHEMSRMGVASACRCPAYNIDIGGSPTSSHIATKEKACTATDFISLGSRWNHFIMEAAFNSGIRRKGFGQIEKVNLKKVTVFHMDTDISKVEYVLWPY